MAEKHNYQYVKKEFANGGCELLSEEYKNARTLLKYKCGCGNISKISYSNFKKGSRCRSCGYKKTSDKKRHNINDVTSTFSAAGCELLTSEYKNSSNKLKYRCICGNISYIVFPSFKAGNRCIKCMGDRLRLKFSYDLSEVKNIFKKENCELVSDFYLNSRSKLDFICSCGNRTTNTLSKFMSGRRCKECSKKVRQEKKKHPYEYVFKYFLDNGCTLIEMTYKDSRTPLKYRCDCGNVSKISFSSFRGGSRCRQCAVNKTSGKNSVHWNNDITQEEREIKRHYPEYRKWRKRVFERDNYICQKCDQIGGILNAHHIENYSSNKKLRLVIDNGITLCKKCHKKYGIKNNTKIQLNEFVNILIYSKVI